MTDAAIEWWGKAGDQALRRSAFQEAISHLGKAIEMADKAEEGKPRGAAGTVSPGERLKLQIGLGQATMWSKGFGSEESKAAFIHAQQLARRVDNASERFTAHYGLWIASLMRGETTLARDIAENFRSSAHNEARSPDEAAASRCLGLTSLIRGDLIAAREQCAAPL